MWIIDFFVDHPELAIFLTIAVGYGIGSVTLGGFSLGPVAGSLFAGLLIGQAAEIPVSETAKSFLFLLFLFGVGYAAGPQFVQAMRSGGHRPALVAVVCGVTGLGAALVLSRLLGLGPGFSAGMMAGALTQTPAIGSATEALRALPIDAAARELQTSHVAVGYAVCYIFGSVGTILYCSLAGPRLLGVDLGRAARDLEQAMGVRKARPGVEGGYRPFQLRAYTVPADADVVGMTLAEAENRRAEARLFVLRLRRGGEIVEARPDLCIEAGDVLAIGGRRGAIIDILGASAAESDDSELLDAPFRASEIVVSAPDVVGRTLGEVAAAPWARGLYLSALRRSGVALPLGAGVALERGDVLEVIGPDAIVLGAAPLIGRRVDPSTATDLVALCLMICLGAAIGAAIRFPVFGVEVALGTSVGALLAGLATGHLRSRHPFFGRVPEASVALMTSLGLAAFLAMVGLQSAPSFLPAVRESGLVLPLGAVAIMLTSLLAGTAFGHFALRMNPVLLFGALSGALTSTPSMAAVQTRAGSALPVLGYAPAYPIGQVILTLSGSLMIVLTS